MHLAPNMDTLVALGSAALFSYSAAVLLKTALVPGYSGDFYFESAAMILTLITLGIPQPNVANPVYYAPAGQGAAPVDGFSFCPRCGTRYEKGKINFCSNCGTKLGE